MKRITSITMILMLLMSFRPIPAQAEISDMFSSFSSLLESMIDDDDEDDSLPSFDGAFKGTTIGIKIGRKTIKVHESFKLAMDKYEAFFDEYINIMTETDPDLTQYMMFITKYTDVMMTLEALDEQEMSDGDAIYYTDTMLRISQKLMSIVEE